MTTLENSNTKIRKVVTLEPGVDNIIIDALLNVSKKRRGEMFRHMIRVGILVDTGKVLGLCAPLQARRKGLEPLSINLLLDENDDVDIISTLGLDPGLGVIKDIARVGSRVIYGDRVLNLGIAGIAGIAEPSDLLSDAESKQKDKGKDYCDADLEALRGELGELNLF